MKILFYSVNMTRLMARAVPYNALRLVSHALFFFKEVCETDLVTNSSCWAMAVVSGGVRSGQKDSLTAIF